MFALRRCGGLGHLTLTLVSDSSVVDMSNSTSTATGSHPPRATLPLLGLALCVLAIGTGEYVVAGMLPAVAGLDVGVPLAGQLVTVYAATVMLAGPALTAVSARRPPKGLLLILMGVFVAGTIGCVLAGSFAVMVAARMVAALAHCTVFAVALVIATQLVPPERVGRAIGAVASGLTMATGLGVPLGTVVQAQVGWRATFALVAVIGAAGLLLLAIVLPRQPRPTPGPLSAQVRVLLRPTVAVTVAVTAFGAGGVVGNALASRTTDAQPRSTLLAVLSAALLVLPATTSTLAAATNVAAFNLANTIGAALGGAVVAGVGLIWTAPVGGIVTLVGLVLAVIVLRSNPSNNDPSAVPDSSPVEETASR